MEDKKLTYKDAGVDTKEGERAVSLMKEHVKGTFNENVLTGLGSFGSLFSLDVKGMTCLLYTSFCQYHVMTS